MEAALEEGGEGGEGNGSSYSHLSEELAFHGSSVLGGEVDLGGSRVYLFSAGGGRGEGCL